MLNEIKNVLIKLLEITYLMETPSEKLYRLAKESLEKDISPTQDELGCAESVSTLIRRVDDTFPVSIGTGDLLDDLIKYCDEINYEVPECIIISATGTQQQGSQLKHGHVGIVGKKLSPDGSLWIMSNDSRSGLWLVNFSVKRWYNYYKTYGKFPVRFFKLKGR